MDSARLALTECHSYQVEELEQALLECLNLLGGMGAYVNPGDKVLLKPNLLQAKPPEEYITTHPSIVEAVINLVRDAGGIPMVGDSPGALERGMEKFWRVTGMLEVCQRLNVELVNFETSGSYLKKVDGKEYYIAKPVLDADLIINLPKIKTHGLTLFTCCVKNLYGTVPGFTKVEYHKQAPKPSNFSELVVDIYSIIQPCLHIVEGVVGMEGAGPSSGDPRELGMILAGNDGVALDSYICYLLGRNPMEIPTNRIAYDKGLGEAEIDKIEVIGEPPLIENFKWPPKLAYTLEMIPGPIARGLMKLWWSRPAINPEKCSKCQKCMKSCPTHALKKPTNLEKAYIPEFDYGDCINCLCCMEMCPEKAVYQDKSFIYKLTSRFSD
jgi:uncharacterized protein (DUF362 family)/Pyruvate/2-oxoacid:ferredoxin oxidoreductase delta subunit